MDTQKYSFLINIPSLIWRKSCHFDGGVAKKILSLHYMEKYVPFWRGFKKDFYSLFTKRLWKVSKVYILKQKKSQKLHFCNLCDYIFINISRYIKNIAIIIYFFLKQSLKIFTNEYPEELNRINPSLWNIKKLFIFFNANIISF